MNEYLFNKAQENLPKLNETAVFPPFEQRTLSVNDEFVLDLGNHYTGYFSFKLNYVDIYIDAPVKLYVKFCETERELADNFAEYKGVLCSSWLQEETVYLDFPKEYSLPRRYAARYIYVKVLATPQKLILSDFKFTAVSSADYSKLEKVEISDKKLAKIDEISCKTLAECMQRVFEDGPKRDRRLWTGDFRLEALTNYYTFRQYDVVKRCLYLFGAAKINESGYLPGYVYENPVFCEGDWHVIDYALLYAVSLFDYVEHTEDSETFEDLYPIAKQQLINAHDKLDGDGIMINPPVSSPFIDWCEGLHKITPLHGVYLYALDIGVTLLKKLGHPDFSMYEKWLDDGRMSAMNVLYDKEKGAFVNHKDGHQYSVHSAVWMVLGGVVKDGEAKRILTEAVESENSLKPFTPYMHHYLVEAYIKAGMKDKARELLLEYWGTMADRGADTFQEVFVKDDAEFSPYGDRMINSMCHAWSCTPSYFIRKYFNE